MKTINDMVAAAKGKQMDPTAFCAKSAPLNAIEVKLLAYLEKNKDWCAIPDAFIDQLKAAHAKSVAFSGKACKVAAEMKKMKEQAARRRRARRAASADRTALSGAAPVGALPDARPASLVLRLTPPWALAFVQLARWDRPAGWQVLLAPCWQAAALAALAADRGPNLGHIALFLVGAISMRGAGCTYNDILTASSTPGLSAPAVGRCPRDAFL